VIGVVGLVCLAASSGLGLVALQTYRRHAQQVLEANVEASKGMGAVSGMFFLPALMGSPLAGEIIQAGMDPRPALPLDVPPVTRRLLIAATALAAGAFACMFCLAGFAPAATALVRRSARAVRRSARAVRGMARAARERRESERAGRLPPTPPPPMDFGSLPQFPSP
jgi:hypothetical protein